MRIVLLLAAVFAFSEAFTFRGGNGNGFSGGRLPPGLSSPISSVIPPNGPLINTPLSPATNLTYARVPSESVLSINASSIIDQAKRYSSIVLHQIVDVASLWWQRLIAVQKQLWVVLAPKVYKQFLLLKAGVPFCLDRTMQYMQPLNLCLLLALSQWRALAVMKYVVKGIAITSFLQMIRDSIKAGSAWMPAVAHPDSYALITGATSGLGKAMASQLYARGYNLILVSRNYTSLEDVRNEFYHEQSVPVEPVRSSPKDRRRPAPDDDTDRGLSPTSTDVDDESSSSRAPPRVYPQNIEIVAADFSDPMAPFQVLRELKILGVENKVDILVANAGKGHYGTVHRTALAEIRDQLEVNVASTVSLIRLMTPRMILRRQQLKAALALQNGIQAIHKERHRHGGIGGGRIVVVSSIAGAGPGADIAVYAAAKSFLTTFALSIRRELLSEGIMVTVAQPGPLSGTHFLTKMRSSMAHVPAAFSLPFLVVRAEDAAKDILRAMYLGREMVAPGVFTKLNLHIVSKLLPPSVYSASVQRMWRPLPRWQSLWPRWTRSKPKKENERKASAAALLAINGDRENQSSSGGDGQGSSADDGPSKQRHHRRQRRRSPPSENRKKTVWASPGSYFTAVQTWYDALTSGIFLLDPEDQAALQRRHRRSHRRRLFPWSKDDDDDGEDGGEDTNEHENEENDDPYRAADRYLQASETQEEATMLYKFFPFAASASSSQHPSPTTMKPDFPASSFAEHDEGETDNEDEEGEGEGEEETGDRPSFAPSETRVGLVLLPPRSPEDEVPLTIPPTAVLEREETP